MYSSSSYTRSLHRTPSYTSSSSRYSGISSSLPPLSTRYSASPASTYSSSLSRKPLSSISYNRSSSVLSTSRVSSYSTTSPSLSSTTSDYQKWRSPITSSEKSYLSRRPSFGSGLTYKSDSITSLSSSTPSVDTEERKSRTLRDSAYSSVSSRNELPHSRYSVTYSGEDGKLAGKVGLQNLGNTCFMNAVLQCLCHTRPLVDYCNQGYFSNDLNYKSPTGGQLIKAFANLIKAMWQNHTLSTTINPDQLKRQLQQYAPRFSGYNQQDAQELLRYLLQGLHDDINRVKIKTNYHSTTNDYSSESQRASDSWSRYQSSDDSKIVDLFGGQLKSTLTCTECHKTSVTFDPFWDLSLPIPEGSTRVTLEECFRQFTAPELLDGYEKPLCERCKKKTSAMKQFEINRFPVILVIHLKRFSSGSNYRNKLNVFVDCCQKNLDLSRFASRTCMNSNSCYNLYGVVDHYGTSSSGHYTAKCKNPYTEEWNEFNDTRVLNTSTIITDSAYLLFYEQVRRFSRL